MYRSFKEFPFFLRVARLFQPRLLQYRIFGAFWQIFFVAWDCDLSWLCRVEKLFVASSLSYFVPSVATDYLDDFFRAHVPAPLLDGHNYNTYCNTCQ